MAGLHRGPSRAHCGLRVWRLGHGRSCGEAADLREPSPLPAPEEGGCRGGADHLALQLRAAAQVPPPCPLLLTLLLLSRTFLSLVPPSKPREAQAQGGQQVWPEHLPNLAAGGQ